MKEIYYIEVGGCRQYNEYDGENKTVSSKALGIDTVMPSERFHDFLATARALGLKAGKL